jgi:predicted adenine nucleotide alpha hydrolase (AANH) superfamily ATPase
MESTGYFYNPNIHPYLEYRKRLDTVKEFSHRVGLDVVYRDGYDLDEFLTRVAGTGARRCEHCYRFRIAAVTAAAKENGFGLFTTSLLGDSKYQNHDLVKAICRKWRASGIEFIMRIFA